MEEIQNQPSPPPEHSQTGENAPLAGTPLQPEGPAPSKCRLGFMKGQFTAQDDIKTMFAEEIEEMFYGYRAQHKFDDIEEAAAERLCQKPKAKS